MSIVNKERLSRAELIQERFKLMIKMAMELKKSSLVMDLANKNKYIRIGGEQFRGVSLADKSPLNGIGNKTTMIETVLGHLKNKQADELSEEALKKKEERRLQAWLIRQALTNPRRLLEPLSLESHFDELIFCLDEVSLGDSKHEREDSEGDLPKIVRCDILALGLRGKTYYPVLIELKSNRMLKRLIEQLDNFIYDITKSPATDMFYVFKDLLKTCSGISDTAILGDKFVKIIVWPKCKNPQKKTVEKLKEAGVLEIEYEYEGDYKNNNKWTFSSY